jgi:outer membrane protein assembly factor BamB
MGKKVLVTALLIFASLGVVLAGTTQIWRQDTAEDFEKGTPTNITIHSDGRLQLAPQLEMIYETGDAYFWAVAEDSKGRLFVGGGNDGKVYVYAAGKGAVFFDAPEMEVHALVIDAQDQLYVGTSPDGKIYRVAPDGSSRVFYEPKVKYIWALAVDQRGNVFAGTGEDGKIFQIDPQGNGKVLFASQEKHVRCLAIDSKGALLAGSAAEARILRLSSDGRPFILYDAPVQEITSIVVAEDGTIYAAGIGKKEGKPGATPPPGSVVVAPSISFTISGDPGVVQQPGRAAGAPGEKGEPPGSEIYRIAPDGYPQSIWKSEKMTVYSLALHTDGSLLAGTGNKGFIYRLESDGVRSAVLARTEPNQVTALWRSRSRTTVYAITSNLTKVYALKSDYAREGSFVSQVKDTVTFSRWGRIRYWHSQAGDGAAIKMYTRSGNTDEPDNTWTDWAEALVSGIGYTASSPPARFIQWKLVLTTVNAKQSPLVDAVELAYISRNVAPKIEAVALQPPDVVYEPQPQFGVVQSAPAFIGGTGGSSDSASSVNAARNRRRQAAAQTPPRQTIKEGYRTITWSVRDPNEDDLVFSLYLRGEGETEWKLLKDKIEDGFYSWDTRTLPDGRYTLRLVVSDERSNPPDLVEKSERLTESFDVDNTPPAISGLTSQVETDGRVRVRFTATDSATPISEADIVVDNGEPRKVLATDGILDWETETFDVAVSGLRPGEHTIIVRVKDGGGNQASAKAVVTVR